MGAFCRSDAEALFSCERLWACRGTYLVYVVLTWEVGSGKRGHGIAEWTSDGGSAVSAAFVYVKRGLWEGRGWDEHWMWGWYIPCLSQRSQRGWHRMRASHLSYCADQTRNTLPGHCRFLYQVWSSQSFTKSRKTTDGTTPSVSTATPPRAPSLCRSKLARTAKQGSRNSHMSVF
ncbi:hypothetical protein BS50DRAFT_353932 [Corynespora cassiicola Philippines]|uniref:Uncharacterized protein n=1 Tax=Corynespora cassiicola Philippines TaxID=1448308 RepID=A0A2T2NRE8_CORCC|nr:hypothetical protein BS50DRAFT_353932 [Corynespora cassiicola Philippines]